MFAAVNEGITKTNDNIFISPLSISMVMTMLASGAEGDTYSEIANTLGFGDMDIDVVSKANANIIKALSDTTLNATSNIANALWLNIGCNINDLYKSKNAYFYNAAITNLDFSDINSVDIINSWASKKTNGLVNQIITQTSPQCPIYISNAVYLKAGWYNKFSVENTKTEFNNYDGSTSMVNYIHAGTLASEIVCEKCRIVTEFLGNQKYKFHFIIPNDGVTTAEAIASLKNESLNTDNHEYLFLYLPKFSISNEYNMANGLMALGINSAFSSSPNFGGITDSNLLIDVVQHNTKINVDEEGIEAAAVTITGFIGASGDGNDPSFRNIRIDHPFGFIISDIETNAILFIGAVNKL